VGNTESGPTAGVAVAPGLAVGLALATGLALAIGLAVGLAETPSAGVVPAMSVGGGTMPLTPGPQADAATIAPAASVSASIR